jgi:L-rhamnose isomerase
MKSKSIEMAYQLARERYAGLGVDTERALRALACIPVSMHCWQGDDVGGFEHPGGALGDGLAVTGNYPGKARTPQELRADFEAARALIPGTQRFNLHASYAEMGAKRVDRDELSVKEFKHWIAWATDLGIGLDFNPTFFSHPNVKGGFTLSHQDSIIIFSTMWGWFFNEWKGSGPRAHRLITTGILALIVSTIVIGFGTWLHGRATGGH